MNRILILLMPLTLVLSSFVTAEQARLDQRVLNEFVTSQQNLATQISLFCEDPNKTVPKMAWSQAAANWFRVFALQLPAAEFMQADHTFIFWPDSKDRLKKQVQAVLHTNPSNLNFSNLPASTTSLSAIEYIYTLENSFEYCDWLISISDLQITQAAQFQKLQTFYEFSTNDQLIALHGTALTLHMQLKEILAKPNRITWQLAPAWRSDLGWGIQKTLFNQLIELLALFESSDGVSVWQEKIANIEVPISDPTRDQLVTLNFFSEELAQFVESSLAPSLGTHLGFNNFDGD